MQFYLAPLQGYTEYFFREAYHQVFENIDVSISPFLSLVHGDITVQNPRFRDVLPENNSKGIPIIPQILGKEPRLFLAMEKCLSDLGYNEINWNLGCPIQGITRKKRGSGMLPYPDMIRSFLDEVMPRMQSRLSVKMRLGYDNPAQIFDLIPILNAYPLSEVCIHPRIGTQMYEGEIYLDIFEQCYAGFKAPVIFNGDIFTVDDFRFLQKKFPSINKWMMGRGVLQNLFLPGELKGIFIDKETKKEKFYTFHQILLSECEKAARSETGLLNKMKDYGQYFCLLFQDSHTVYRQIVETQTIAQYRQAWQNIKDSQDFRF